MRSKLFLTAARITAISWTAEAATPCAARDQMLAQFAEKYNESSVALGLDADGRLVVVLASDRGTWSIPLTVPDGQSCIVATGENWRAIGSEPQDPEA